MPSAKARLRKRTEVAEHAARFLEAELKWASVTYEELAKRLKGHRSAETRDWIDSKLKRAGDHSASRVPHHPSH